MTPEGPHIVLFFLPWMGIESHLVRAVDFNDVVNVFAQRQRGKNT